jgi:type I restriction enzyme S subunit
MPTHCSLKVADILLSLTGNVGRCCLVTVDGCLLNQRVAKIQPVKEFDWAYSYLMFRSTQLQEQLKAIANGVAQQNLSPIETQRILVLLPPEVLRQHFADTAAGLLRLALTLLRSNTNLRTTRDLLLPKLISGELDVSELPEPEALPA